jgi:hypothetical protein
MEQAPRPFAWAEAVGEIFGSLAPYRQRMSDTEH